MVQEGFIVDEGLRFYEVSLGLYEGSLKVSTRNYGG